MFSPSLTTQNRFLSGLGHQVGLLGRGLECLGRHQPVVAQNGQLIAADRSGLLPVSARARPRPMNLASDR